MSESFAVKFYAVPKQDTAQKQDTEHYYARWYKGRYIAENIRCHISACREYENIETTFTCSSCTLDACISEAEMMLHECDCGKAELFDGDYRVATVTKHLGEWLENSNLTKYGVKCHAQESQCKFAK